jgi:tetratricopeptide (TPR) repeat protein
MYYSIGGYYEDIGKLIEAQEAYYHAASWYPTVWADPYIALARIEADQGKVASAIEILRTSLDQATLPQCIFQISRVLGYYYLQIDDPDKAYCAFKYADEVGTNLIEAYAPLQWREDIVTQTNMLEQSIGYVPECSWISNQVGIPK